MIITKKHADLIKMLKEKWQQGTALDRVLDQLDDEQLEYIFHLDLAGLVEETDEGFCFSQAGHLISEAIDECLKTVGEYDSWPDNFKFIGSEIISMIEVARLAQGDVEHQPEIKDELEKRGFAKDGRLLPLAESILEAYDIAFPRISMDKNLLEAYKKIPPGPGNKSLLQLSKEQIYQLEAMRLLTFSLPFGNSYSLTGPGQHIRSALLLGLSTGRILDDEVLLSLLQENPDENTVLMLQEIGAVDSDGSLLPAGEALFRAAHLLYVEPIELNPSISLSNVDLEVLEGVENLTKLVDDGSVDSRDIKSLKTYLNDKSGLSSDVVQKSLYHLEGFSLIKYDSCEKGPCFSVTEMGKAVLQDRKQHGFNGVSAKSVMAITTTRMENLSPDDTWVNLAENEGLIGKAFPTKSGQLFAKVASEADRLPCVDSMQRRVLNFLPFWRGLFWESIKEGLQELGDDELSLALDKLVANGLVDLLPGGLYKITQAGVAFKRAMSVVPEGIEFHVTPEILKVLLAAADNQINNKIDWKKTEKECELDIMVMEETVLHMRKLMYIKSDKITNAGKLLLEGLNILNQAKISWHDMDV